MAAPYFLDLRRKVVQACNRPGQSQRAVAELFGVMVVMDNLAAYKVDGIRSASEATGAALMFLPPYSPDDSPIKPCWSKLKTCLRAIKTRTREALDEALAHAIDTVTVCDAKGWFAHCGYAFH